jgi:DNA polymerase
VQSCRGCELYKRATQAVFGEGLKQSTIVMVGEQPGDKEDQEGHPFVGPAGGILSRALSNAGLDRRDIFLTNAVKHFSWEPQGKRRLHKRPTARQFKACRPWLEAEIEAVKPDIVVALGAAAAQTMYGWDFSVTRRRGAIFESEWAPRSMATVHPASVLRSPDDDRRDAYAAFVRDLRVVADAQAE